MKLDGLNDAIAETCDVQGDIVAAVQRETFQKLRAAVEKGDWTQVPEFGAFLPRKAEGGYL